MRIYQWMLLGLALATTPVFAGPVYKWVDPAGRIHYGDQPQPGWKRIEINAPPSSGSPPPAAKPAAAAASASGIAALAPDAEQCENKRKSLESYQKATRLVERDSLGREKEFTPEDRQKLIELTQQQLDQVCAGRE
jgi:hypothetical protein